MTNHLDDILRFLNLDVVKVRLTKLLSCQVAGPEIRIVIMEF